MADVRPFRGLRFPLAVAADVGHVLSPPYDVIDADDDRRLRARHPYNVVRLELTTASVAGGPDERYAEAARTLRGWREQGALRRDERPAYYLHEADFEAAGRRLTRRELIAAVTLEPWERRVILPHERTYPRAKADRLRLLAATETNLSPILVFFQRDDAGPAAGVNAPAADAVDAAWAWATRRAPDAAGTDSEGVGHRLWVLTDTALVDGLRAYFAARPLFIADGHHRYETALTYLDDRRKLAGGSLPADHPASAVMMHLIAQDDPGLVILPLHRLVTGLTPADVQAVVESLGDGFTVAAREIGTAHRLNAALAELAARGADGQALGLLAAPGDTMLLVTRPASAPLPAAIPSDRDRSWRSLDVVLIDYTVVRPLLAARQLHAEDAIAYTRDAHDAVARVRAGSADLAVLVNPTRAEQVADVSLAGERMPEKSTYFYPKAPTGLVLRPLE